MRETELVVVFQKRSRSDHEAQGGTVFRVAVFTNVVAQAVLELADEDAGIHRHHRIELGSGGLLRIRRQHPRAIGGLRYLLGGNRYRRQGQDPDNGEQSHGKKGDELTIGHDTGSR